MRSPTRCPRNPPLPFRLLYSKRTAGLRPTANEDPRGRSRRAVFEVGGFHRLRSAERKTRRVRYMRRSPQSLEPARDRSGRQRRYRRRKQIEGRELQRRKLSVLSNASSPQQMRPGRSGWARWPSGICTCISQVRADVSRHTWLDQSPLDAHSIASPSRELGLVRYSGMPATLSRSAAGIRNATSHRGSMKRISKSSATR